MTIRTVEINGDRQTGKSHLAMLAALQVADTGGRVLYVCERGVESRAMLDRIASEVSPRLIRRVSRASSDLRIDLINGGTVVFASVRSPGRGFDADLVVLDGLDHPIKVRKIVTPSLLTASNPRMIIVHRSAE